jgi:peptide/nickel transport system substrate-binding protein
MNPSSTRTRRGAAAVGLLAVVAMMAGCGGGSTTAAAANQSVIWGNTGEPDTLDPAYATAGVAWVPDHQIYEGLVTTSADGSQIVPQLATSWKADDARTTWTFTLRSGVKFQDGTDFDASAVCYNFDRWYNFSGVQQSSAVSYWYQSVFGGFATSASGSPTPGLYKSCSAPSATTTVVTLTSPSASFIPALSMVPFGMASPAALKQYQADAIGGSSGTPNFDTPFGSQHPVGTGPYMLKNWQKGQQIELLANPKYWGSKPAVSRVVIKSMTDSTARLQAMQSGTITGYSNVPASDVATLQGSSSAKVYTSAPYTVGYVGFNSTVAPFDNPLIRQAIAHALNREAVVKAMFPSGSRVADELSPKPVAGYSSDIPDASYDVEKAKALLAQAGNPHPTIEFAFPTGVSRPYMPNPSNIFQAFQADLQAAGFTVKPVSIPWGQYASQLLAGKLGMYLWGSIGSYPSDSYFLSLYTSQTHLSADLSANVKSLLKTADSESDDSKRIKLYEQINTVLMQNYVAVPFIEPPIITVLNAKIRGYKPDPYGNVNFASLSVGK